MIRVHYVWLLLGRSLLATLAAGLTVVFIVFLILRLSVERGVFNQLEGGKEREGGRERGREGEGGREEGRKGGEREGGREEGREAQTDMYTVRSINYVIKLYYKPIPS